MQSFFLLMYIRHVSNGPCPHMEVVPSMPWAVRHRIQDCQWLCMQPKWDQIRFISPSNDLFQSLQSSWNGWRQEKLCTCLNEWDLSQVLVSRWLEALNTALAHYHCIIVLAILMSALFLHQVHWDVQIWIEHLAAMWTTLQASMMDRSPCSKWAYVSAMQKVWRALARRSPHIEAPTRLLFDDLDLR